jgi:hypothetical protein
MPLLILPFVLLGVLIYGAITLYKAVAAAAGQPAGIAAVSVALAAVVAMIVAFIGNYRAIHGKSVDGRRILATHGPWGEVSIDANEKRGTLAVDGANARFLFADIAHASPSQDPSGWALALHLNHQARAEWRVPMTNHRQARRWARILALAAEQKL